MRQGPDPNRSTSITNLTYASTFAFYMFEYPHIHSAFYHGERSVVWTSAFYHAERSAVCCQDLLVVGAFLRKRKKCKMQKKIPDLYRHKTWLRFWFANNHAGNRHFEHKARFARCSLQPTTTHCIEHINQARRLFTSSAASYSCR